MKLEFFQRWSRGSRHHLWRITDGDTVVCQSLSPRATRADAEADARSIGELLVKETERRTACSSE